MSGRPIIDIAAAPIRSPIRARSQQEQSTGRMAKTTTFAVGMTCEGACGFEIWDGTCGGCMCGAMQGGLELETGVGGGVCVCLDPPAH